VFRFHEDSHHLLCAERRGAHAEYATIQRAEGEGIDCHFLYQWFDPRAQRDAAVVPIHVTDDDGEIRNLLADERYDLVIVNANYLMLERIRRYGYSGPVIFECHGMGTIEETIGEILKALPYIHSCSNAILYPKTEHMRRLFKSLYPAVRQHSFHNCLDTRVFTYRPPASPPADPIIGWVGRIERNKNWRAFLRMAKVWTDRFPQLRIWLFEDVNLYEAGEREAFEAMLAGYAFGERLVRHTNIPHAAMAEMYSTIGDSGGFLCSTSLNEGFGYALLEAMSCRCPVLASDSDGPRSFIVPGKTGMMYQAGEEEVGIRKGIELLTNSKMREKIRSQGQKHIQEHFSLEVYAENFMRMLRELGVM
jgi:glycosyltransferase involved in cell wall biosynthesis